MMPAADNIITRLVFTIFILASSQATNKINLPVFLEQHLGVQLVARN